MKNRRTRRWTTSLRKTIIAIFAVVFSLSLVLASNASAVTNIFKIEDVKLDRLSETTEGEIVNFDDSNISTSAVFHRVGDAVKYTLTLKNSDKEDRSIKSITDSNTNTYISYEYDSYENTVVKAGETFDFVVTARYINSISSFDERTQTPNVKFAIDYLNNDYDYYNNNDDNNSNGNGNYYYTEVEEIVLVPNTGRNTAGVTSSTIKNNVYVLLGFAVGLTIYIVIVAKKHNKNPKIILCMLVLIAAAAVTTSIRALSTETNTISFSENYSLLDKVAVTYVIDGNRETEAVQYGNKINKENPKKAETLSVAGCLKMVLVSTPKPY